MHYGNRRDPMPSTISSQLADTDLVGLTQLLAAGEVHASELIEASIERAERLNPELGAIITPLYDEARAELDATTAGPFRLPYLLKDIGAGARGVRTTWASDWVGDTVPERDGHLASRLRRAGLIFIGTSAVPELGVAASTESARFGPTRNPWDVTRTAGGSSGGAAAAVASGIVPAAHANDASGSIRIPAACCGVFGMKPSRGRVSPAPGGEWSLGASVQHAVTRTVRDSAALLEIVAGPVAGDLFSPAPLAGSLVDAITREPGTLRIGLSVVAPGGTPVDPACAAAARMTATLLEQLGHHVEEATPELAFDEVSQAQGVIEAAGIALMLEAFEHAAGPATGALPPVLAALRLVGDAVTTKQYLAAEAALQRLARPASAFWERYDLWLTPTLGSPPVALGAINVRDEQIDRFWERDRAFNPWTPIANWLGQPAASLPLHRTHDGLPVGVQLQGRVGDDLQLLQVCRQLEEAHPWRHVRPSVHAFDNTGGSR
jgi:amidase